MAPLGSVGVVAVLLAALVCCTAAARPVAAPWAAGGALAPPPGGGVSKKRPECMWREYHRLDKISAWEFQMQPHRHKIQDRDRAIHKIEALLRKLSGRRGSGVKFIEDSMWMTIFEEVAFLATERDGSPLHPERAPPGERHPFPWRGRGFIRVRRYRVTLPEGKDVPTAVPGTADLTFKMKKVDPQRGVGPLELPQQAAGAKLTAKVENDIHCDHQRDTMSPLWRPVPLNMDASRAAFVKDYFPNLAEVALIDAHEPLPFMHKVHRAKIVWAVDFAGVRGEANLVIKYNTTYQDALSGARPKNGEASLRIRREKAGEVSPQQMEAGLNALADACQAFRDAGWDGKTGPWGSRHSVASSTAGAAGGRAGRTAAPAEGQQAWDDDDDDEGERDDEIERVPAVMEV